MTDHSVIKNLSTNEDLLKKYSIDDAVMINPNASRLNLADAIESRLMQVSALTELPAISLGAFDPLDDQEVCDYFHAVNQRIKEVKALFELYFEKNNEGDKDG